MKIAMPKNGELINQHFGKSESFAIITIEDKSIKEMKEISTKDLLHNHEGLSSFLLKENVSVVITGGIGMGALEALKNSKLKVIRGASGSINEIVQNYLNDNLEDKNVVCNHHHDHKH